ncbi:MAG: cysteine--tRNA ligase [Bryobacteraceae bacterium]|nr:cysteine--tRNA ligase [Bryobacteraceae bacterium]
MGLRFYNTLSQEVEPFVPQSEGEVRMYTCGPTVWNYVHIGNLRTFTFQDLLRRWLKYRGYRMNHVMNITDVDDRIIKESGAANKSLGEYTEVYEKAFFEDTAKLRLEKPERVVRATEHIAEMVGAIEKLAEKGFTYESEGSTYYRISQFPEYGKLSHIDFSGIRAGARVDTDKYDKDNVRDFVLWKARKGDEPFWPTALGDGRPGWHIECSAMAMKYLGDTLDVHAGGVDLQFPHHENEIAQSEAITGRPFARYWLHSEHLIVEGQTMSKSLGNFFTLRDLVERGYPPEVVRYLLASVPYRKKLNFTFDGLKGAAASIERLRSFQLRLDTDVLPEGSKEEFTKRVEHARHQFEESLDDDLNTAEALAAVFEFIRDANTAMDAGSVGKDDAAQARAFLGLFDSVFDVLKPTEAEGGLSEAEIDQLVADRTAAKKAKNFKRADEIRQQLMEAGVIVEDTKDGVRWKRKAS